MVPPTLAALRTVGELPDIKTVSDTAAVPDFRKDAIKRLSYRKFEIFDVVLKHAAVKPIEILRSPVKSPFGNIVSGSQREAAALVIAKAPFPAVKGVGDLRVLYVQRRIHQQVWKSDHCHADTGSKGRSVFNSIPKISIDRGERVL